MKIMMLDNFTIKEIDRKLKNLKRDPELDFVLCNQMQNALRKTEFLNSFLMEHPEYYKHSRGGFYHGYTHQVREGVKRMEIAWDCLKEKSLLDGGKLSSELVLAVGREVDVRNDGYRQDRVSLNLPQYTPPNPLKIPFLIEQMVKDLETIPFHPIERAAFVHSRIAAIQPFIDGNKRTARLIQNKILCDNNYPYATIPLAERDFYIGLLEESMCAYRDRELKKMGPFFNYVSAKVNVALDEALLQRDRLKRKKSL